MMSYSQNQKLYKNRSIGKMFEYIELYPERQMFSTWAVRVIFLKITRKTKTREIKGLKMEDEKKRFGVMI